VAAGGAPAHPMAAKMERRDASVSVRETRIELMGDVH